MMTTQRGLICCTLYKLWLSHPSSKGTRALTFLPLQAWEVWLLRYLLCQVASDFFLSHWWVQDQRAPHQELEQRKITRTSTLWDRWTSLVRYRLFLKWPRWAAFPSQTQSVSRKDRRWLYYSQLPYFQYIRFYTLERLRMPWLPLHEHKQWE